MKKFFYFLTVVFVLSIAVSSCTEENVKPQTGDSSGGGVSDPIK
jgi:hypothetical protein